MNKNEVKDQKDPIDVLIEKYPTVFQDIDLNTPYNLPSGWFNLVDSLCSKLKVLLEEERKKVEEIPGEPLFVTLQIKEKFGGLRFYYMMNTENKELYSNIQKLIDEAEDQSYNVCQVTGNPGNLCKSGWHFQTLCEELRILHGFKIVGHKECN